MSRTLLFHWENMKKRFTLAVLVALLVLSHLSCTSKVYTKIPGASEGDLLNRASQDDLLKKYGPPTSKSTLTDGGEVWAYDFRSTTTISGNQDQTTTATQCYRIIYVFDKEKVLRDYKRQPC